MQSGVKVMPNIDIRKIFEEQASEAETKRAMEILARPERDEEVIVRLVDRLVDAALFWADRCERVEKQRDELIKALEMLEKIFADKDFIKEDESEDFLHHVWTLAHGALYNLKRELAQEAQP